MAVTPSQTELKYKKGEGSSLPLAYQKAKSRLDNHIKGQLSTALEIWNDREVKVLRVQCDFFLRSVLQNVTTA